MEAIEAINARHSVRSYTDEPVSSAQIKRLIEAANAAPCGMHHNDKRHIAVVTDKEILGQIRMAGTAAMGRDLMYGAPLLFVVSGQPEDDMPDMEKYDAAVIIENVLIEATELGLGSVFLLGLPKAVLSTSSALQKKLHIPEGYVPLAAAAIGHAAEPVTGPHDGFKISLL